MLMIVAGCISILIQKQKQFWPTETTLPLHSLGFVKISFLSYNVVNLNRFPLFVEESPRGGRGSRGERWPVPHTFTLDCHLNLIVRRWQRNETRHTTLILILKCHPQDTAKPFIHFMRCSFGFSSRLLQLAIEKGDPRDRSLEPFQGWHWFRSSGFWLDVLYLNLRTPSSSNRRTLCGLESIKLRHLPELRQI